MTVLLLQISRPGSQQYGSRPGTQPGGGPLLHPPPAVPEGPPEPELEETEAAENVPGPQEGYSVAQEEELQVRCAVSQPCHAVA